MKNKSVYLAAICLYSPPWLYYHLLCKERVLTEGEWDCMKNRKLLAVVALVGDEVVYIRIVDHDLICIDKRCDER